MSRGTDLQHADAWPHLPDLVCGRAPASLRPALEAHLETCEECRALADVYRPIACVVRSAEAPEPTGHLPAHDIVAFAIDRGALPPSEAERVEDHLRGCPSCSEDLEITRQAHRATRAPAIVRRFPFTNPHSALWSRQGLGALAAALAVAVLAYPAFLGLVALPEVRNEVESLRATLDADRQALGSLESSLDVMRERLQGSGSWSGPVDLTVLEGPGRSPGRDPIVRIEPGQPFAAVAVLPPLPGGAAKDAAYLFEVGGYEAPAGTPDWSARMTAGEIRARLGRAGVVAFLIPADRLPAGPRVLRFRQDGASRGADLLEARFTVVR